TVVPGATTGNTSTITLAPRGGFIGSVALTAAVTSSPPGVLSPPIVSFGSLGTVSITGVSFGTATLTISTEAPTHGCSSAHLTEDGTPWYVTGSSALACVLLCGVPMRRRGWQRGLGMLAALIALS